MAASIMPGVRTSLTGDGGSMVGGPPRVVWHTTESDPGSLDAVVRYLAANRSAPHLVWDPSTGGVVQMIPANRAARALMHPAGTTQTNRQGSACIQIEVIGRASHPFTARPMKGREAILSWLDSFGVPRAAYSGPRMGGAAWQAFRGHCGHAHVPANNHTDPGAIDWRALLAAPAPTPVKRYSMLLFGARGIDHQTADLVHQMNQRGVVTCDVNEAKAAIGRGEVVVVVGGPAATALGLTPEVGKITIAGSAKIAVGRTALESLSLALTATA